CCRQPTYTNTIFELPLSGPTALQWTRHDVLPAGFHMRQGASFSYDAARDVAWLYGGEDSTFTSLGDVWQVSLAGVPAVAPVTTTGTPPEARQFHAATFDAAGDRLIVFGGQVADGTPRNDTWALEAGAGNAWVALAPTGTLPPARFHMASAFDAAGDRLVVFGGSGLSILYDDTWAL